MIATEVQYSSRWKGRAPTQCLRRALGEGSGPGHAVSRSFLRELYRLDPGLELHWVHGINKWVLYRLSRRGVVPGEDVLTKEVEVRGPRGEYRDVGQWVIDFLRKHDKTRNGAVDPAYANRQYIANMTRRDREHDESWREKFNEAQAEGTKELIAHGVFGRTSRDMPIGTTKALRKKKVKRCAAGS